MTNTLTNVEICGLMGWVADTGARDKSYVGAPTVMDIVGWRLPDESKVYGTPAFNGLEQPWFEFVVPWLKENKYYYCLASYPAGAHVVLQDRFYSIVGSGKDKEQAHIAFNKALYQLREQL